MGQNYKQLSIKHYKENVIRTDNTMVKRKRTNNDIQNTTQKIKDDHPFCAIENWISSAVGQLITISHSVLQQYIYI
jgi:hypothetical protein